MKKGFIKISVFLASVMFAAGLYGQFTHVPAIRLSLNSSTTSNLVYSVTNSDNGSAYYCTKVWSKTSNAVTTQTVSRVRNYNYNIGDGYKTTSVTSSYAFVSTTTTNSWVPDVFLIGPLDIFKFSVEAPTNSFNVFTLEFYAAEQR